MAIDTDRVRWVMSAEGFDLSTDYHRLPSSAAEALAEEARRQGYRAPRHANGSRARCFLEAAQRKDARERRARRGL